MSEMGVDRQKHIEEIVKSDLQSLNLSEKLVEILVDKSTDIHTLYNETWLQVDDSDLNACEYKGHLPKDEENEEYNNNWVEEAVSIEGSQTYFTYINETRSKLKKDSQAFISYGNRTNAHLVVNYGFTF